MPRIKLVLLFTLLFFVSSATPLQAAMVHINKNGTYYLNVLAEETSVISVKNVSVTTIVNTLSPDPETKIALSKKEGQTFLTVDKNTMDVSGYSDDIVEVEQYNEPERIAIKATNDGFAIEQRGITAKTVFPISINSPSKKISVETPTGVKFLSIMPYEAVAQIIRSNIIDDLGESGEVQLVEGEEGEVLYIVKGIQELNLLRFLSIPVDVVAEVSAVSGRVLKVDQPLWYSILGIILV